MVDVRRLRNSTEQAGWIASRPDRRGHPGILLRPALTGLPGSASIAPSVRRRSPRVSQARETDQVAFFLRIVICYWSTVFGPMFRAFMVLLRSVPLACQPAILPWSRAGYNPAGALEVHIRRLRTKIESNADRPTRIRTVRGVGYVFDLPPDD